MSTNAKVATTKSCLSHHGDGGYVPIRRVVGRKRPNRTNKAKLPLNEGFKLGESLRTIRAQKNYTHKAGGVADRA